MENRRQSLLFEPEDIPQIKRADVLRSLFCEHAASEHDSSPSPPYVPVQVLAAHGELDSCLRHLIKAAEHTHRASRPALRALRNIEKLLDNLPESIMRSLYAAPQEDWNCCYRDMARIHELLDSANLVVDAQEYVNIVGQMMKLVQAISAVSRVQINAASAFALWLLHSQSQPEQKRRRTRKKKIAAARKSPKSRGTTQRKTSESTKGV